MPPVFLPRSFDKFDRAEALLFMLGSELCAIDDCARAKKRRARIGGGGAVRSQSHALCRTHVT
eukprot:5036945-Pleurochrysis_carterae.AAC.1